MSENYDVETGKPIEVLALLLHKPDCHVSYDEHLVDVKSVLLLIDSVK